VIQAMLAEWRTGARVVWATRRVRPGEKAHAGFAAIYYWIMRRVVGMTEMPERGADFFLIDRLAIDAFRQCDERNVSVLALITWLGFPQAVIEYDKQPRAAGVSGWTLARKVKLVVDSVTAFSDLPIWLCACVGGVLLVAGVAGVVAGLAAAPGGRLVALAGLVVAMTGVQLVGLGIVGAYVSRGLDEARGRPAYFVERLAGRHPSDSAGGRTI
jgi:dolichol-phosphate mannosyltransferase